MTAVKFWTSQIRTCLSAKHILLTTAELGFPIHDGIFFATKSLIVQWLLDNDGQ